MSRWSCQVAACHVAAHRVLSSPIGLIVSGRYSSRPIRSSQVTSGLIPSCWSRRNRSGLAIPVSASRHPVKTRLVALVSTRRIPARRSLSRLGQSCHGHQIETNLIALVSSHQNKAHPDESCPVAASLGESSRIPTRWSRLVLTCRDGSGPVPSCRVHQVRTGQVSPHLISTNLGPSRPVMTSHVTH